LPLGTGSLVSRVTQSGTHILHGPSDITFQAISSGLQAGKVVGAVAKVCGGGGGGKPGLAQAGGKDASKFGEAMELAKKTLLGL
jgi:alanyl-tRNA synthetase